MSWREKVGNFMNRLVTIMMWQMDCLGTKTIDVRRADWAVVLDGKGRDIASVIS